MAAMRRCQAFFFVLAGWIGWPCSSISAGSAAAVLVKKSRQTKARMGLRSMPADTQAAKDKVVVRLQ